MLPDYLDAVLWFLLPVAAASGWLAARRAYGRQRDANPRPNLSSDYFKGLNYLLNEQPDKAIDVFIKMLEVESETVETHLALGNLFRRRGEVDRAIRIHQNLIARPTLSRQQRCLALLELGVDYMRSGLLDRAENLFQELLETDFHGVEALRQLVDIYQQEQDWDKAIVHARKLAAKSGENLGALMAHYHCEQAEQARQQGRSERAEELVRLALAVDPGCVRASLMAGEMAMGQGRHAEAIRWFRRVETQDPDFLSETVRPLQTCYRALGRSDEFKDYLVQLTRQKSRVTPVLVLAELIAEQDGTAAAADFIAEELRRRPSVRGLDRLVQYSLARAEGSARENLMIIKDFTDKLLERRSIYKCGHCGFSGKALHWQCPGCKHWNTVRPIHGIEGE